MTRTVLLGLLVLLAALRPAAAEDEAPPPKAAHVVVAEAVLAAHGEGDAAAIGQYAARDAPDPWLIADELCRRLAFDAALAFAKAAPRPAVARLPAYVEARRGKEPDEETRRILADVLAAIGKQDLQGVLDAAARCEGKLDSIPRIRICYGRGFALRMAKRPAEAAPVLIAAADGMRDLGWSAMAVKLYDEGGYQAYVRQDWALAVESQKRAHALRLALGDLRGAAGTLGNIGNLQMKLERFEEALATQREVLTAMEALKDEKGRAKTVSNIATLLTHLERYEEALATQMEALALFRAQKDRPEAARTLGNIGTIHERLGDYGEALRYQTECLSEMRDMDQLEGMARALLNLGSLCAAIPDFPRAIAVNTEALKLKRRLEDRRGEAAVLTNLGLIHARMSDFQRALNHQHLAATILKGTGNTRDAAVNRANMAWVYSQMGQFPRAMRMLEEVLAEQRATKPVHLAGVALSLGNLTEAHLEVGDLDAALITLKDGLRVQEQLKNEAGVRRCRLLLGHLHEDRGDLDEALALHRQVLESALARKDRTDEYVALASLGEILQAKGRYAEALEAHEKALALLQDLGVRGDAARTHGSIGLAHLALGNRSQALAHLKLAVGAARALRRTPVLVRYLGPLARMRLEAGENGLALGEAQSVVRELEDLFGGLAEGQGARARAQFGEVFEVGALAAARLEDEAECLRFLESGRAGQLLESLRGRQALRYTDLPEELARAEQEAKAAVALARHQLRRAKVGNDLEGAIARRKVLDDALARRRAVSDRIWRAAKQQAEIFYPRPVQLGAIAGRVPADAALVVYGLCLDEALAMVITREETRIVPLGGAAPIREACEALELEKRRVDPTKTLATLAGLLVAPLKLPAGAKHVLVSPSGPIGYLPFGALLPERTVTLTPSASTYVLLDEERAEPGTNVLALGDPVYGEQVDAEAAGVYMRGPALTRLEASGAEAKAIGDLVLLRERATEAGLREALSTRERWRSVHLGCHGLIDPERPTLSSLALTRAGDDDGFLTCLEVLRMEVPADLVVLSACRTALGRIYRGEGIIGLSRAFMYAGAPRVLCSLWRVPDEPTRVLMEKFYALWRPEPGKQGMTPAQALRAAQAHVRAQPGWSHPHYWAAWVLWGLAD